MAHISFNEYVKKQDKGPKAKTALVADYDGPSVAGPKTGMMPDNAGGMGQKGKMTPYAGKEKAVDPNKGKLTDGLAKKPEHSKLGQHGHPSKVLGNYPTMKTSEWLKKTGKMSLSEFAKTVRNERTAGLESPSKTYEAIKETFASCKQNRSWVKDAVSEMKRCGLFETFFAAMSTQPEAAGVIAKLMESESFARKLVFAIDEMVAPPVGGGDEDMGSDEGDKEMKHHRHGHHHDDDGMEDDEDGMGHHGDESDEDESDEEESDEDEDMEGGEMDDEEGMKGEIDADGDEESSGGGEEMPAPRPSGDAKSNLMNAMKGAGFM